MLPDIPGTEVCRRIRGGEAGSRQPAVMMLTAKGEEIDRVVGFELGADDYVVKPFSVRELLLRVGAISGAPPASRERASEPQRCRYAVGPLELDVDGYHVSSTARKCTSARWRCGCWSTWSSTGARPLARGSAGGRLGLQAGRLDAHHRHPRQAPARQAGDAGPLVETVAARAIGCRPSTPSSSKSDRSRSSLAAHRCQPGGRQ